MNDEDEYHLLLNGSIYAPQHMPAMLAPGELYCMEVVLEADEHGQLGNLGLKPLVCFAEGALIVRKPSFIISFPPSSSPLVILSREISIRWR